MKKNLPSNHVRNSSIELLKIIAIIIIVINHVTQTIDDSVINLNNATTNFQYLILILMRYFGEFGNTIFFVCSAWFLLDDDTINWKKWFYMIVEVWVVSVLILIPSLAILKGKIYFSAIIKCLLPSTFANNWYITCYLLFYLIHPFLNKIIETVDQKHLLRISFILTALYLILDFFVNWLFFPSDIIVWTTVYFIMAYTKKYLPSVSNNIKTNILLGGGMLAGFLFLIALTNYLGLRIEYFSDKMQYWNINCNPFIIFFVITIFNISRQFAYYSRPINYISHLSLLIYITHENLLVRIYFRPWLLKQFIGKFGTSKILFIDLLLSGILFAICFVSCFVYDLLLRKYVKRLSGIFEKYVIQIFKGVEDKILRLD